jgi:hypothetical protein
MRNQSRRRRCVLPMGHGGTHLFVLSATTTLIGECTAIAPRRSEEEIGCCSDVARSAGSRGISEGGDGRFELNRTGLDFAPRGGIFDVTLKVSDGV